MNKPDRYDVFLLVLIAFLTGIAFRDRFSPQTAQRPLEMRQERKCDDIIRYEDGSLGCEINMQAEDDAIEVQQI